MSNELPEWLPWAVAVIVLGAVAACRSATPAPSIVSVTQAPGVATPVAQTTLAAAPSALTGAGHPETTGVPSALPGAAPAAGSAEQFGRAAARLEELQTYNYQIAFEVVGAGGPDQAVRIDLRGEHQEPDRERVRWVLPDGGQFMAVVRIGDELWLQEGDAWSLLTADEAKDVVMGLITPRQVWESFANDLAGTSQLVGEEVVNGIRSLHYTSTSRAWGTIPLQGGGQLSDSNGDFWVARDGGFPVQAHFSGSGTDQAGQPVTVTFEFDVREVNEPLSITPPDQAP